jgi:hypothetical protein
MSLAGASASKESKESKADSGAHRRGRATHGGRVAEGAGLAGRGRHRHFCTAILPVPSLRFRL